MSRKRFLTAAEVKKSLRKNTVRLVIADVGASLRWVEHEKTYFEWREEIAPHLADPNTIHSIANFPDNYFYLASEWKGTNDQPVIILLEKHH